MNVIATCTAQYGYVLYCVVLLAAADAVIANNDTS